MGRVRRYRKIKSCDPFSKQKASKSKTEDLYDEPPDLHEARALRKERKMKRKSLRELDWDNDEDRERLLQLDAKRLLNEASREGIASAQKLEIEPRRDGESLKQFTRRVREETRRTLVSEVSRMTATAKRRREQLQKRKFAKKQKKIAAKDDDDDEQVFGSREDGFIRPSDRGEAGAFPRAEANVGLSDQPLQPPILDHWALQLNKGPKISSHNKQIPTSSSNISEYENLCDESLVVKPKNLKLSALLDKVDRPFGMSPSSSNLTSNTPHSSETLARLRDEAIRGYRLMKAAKNANKGSYCPI